MVNVVFKNEDLKRHIFSFGYPEHRTFTRSLKESLHVDCKWVEWMREKNQGDRCMEQYLLDEYTDIELMKCMRYLNRCRCCTRHSHFKPYMDGNEIRMPINDTRSFNRECHCPCRFLARAMATAYGNYMIVTNRSKIES
jgi:hypothetical protein